MTKFVVSLTVALALPSSAQGTFNVYAESHYASIPTVNRMWGNFAVTEQGVFIGTVDVEFGVQTDIVQIFRSLSPDTVGQPLFSLTEQGGFYPTGDPQDPGSSGWGFAVAKTLSPSEWADLQAGNWWVGTSLSALPGRDIRGQITAVPEPSTIALVSIGLLAIWNVAMRRKGPKHAGRLHENSPN